MHPRFEPPADEAARLAALELYEILDTEAEAAFDDLTALASHICQTPIALLSLLDKHRQWLKSRLGVDLAESPRSIAFCNHPVRLGEFFEVNDALADERFRDNPFVTGEPGIRFYAGAPLVTPDGHALGALCVIDRQPRRLDEAQKDALRRLARQAIAQMELRRANRRIARESTLEHAILASADSAIIATTPDGLITHFNPAAEQMLGYSSAELLRAHAPSLFHDSRELAERARSLSEELGRPVPPGFEVFVALARAGRPETREWTYIRKDGGRLPVLLSVSAIHDASGALVGFLGIARDISARKRIEAALRESEVAARRLALVAERTSNAVIITDADGRIEWVNQGFTRITGYASAEVLGRKPGSFLGGPETDPATASLMRERLRARQPVEVEIVNYGKSGRKYWLRIAIEPIFDARGELAQFMAVETEITAIKETEAALRLERQRLRNALEGSKLGTWEWEVQTGKTTFNERWAEIIGHRLDELAPVDIQTWIRHCHPEDLRRSQAALERHFAGETPVYECECRMRHKDGRWVWVMDRGQVISRDAAGRPLMMYGTHADISRRKAEEESARDAQARLERLVEERTASLAAGERSFRATFDNAAVGIAHVGHDGRFLRFNRHLCEMLRHPPDRFAELTFQAVTHPDDLAADLVEARRLFAGEIDSFTMEKRYLRRDGSIVWGHLRASSVRDASGKIEYAVAVVTDISSRKQTEAVLRALSAQATPRPADFFRFVARLAAETLGAAFSFVVKHRERQAASPETLAAWVDGRPASGVAFPADGPLGAGLASGDFVFAEDAATLLPGSSFLAESGATSFAAVPLLNGSGRPLGFLAVMDRRPMEDPRRIEALLKLMAVRTAAEIERLASERRFAELLEFAPDATFIADESGNIEQINREVERIFGYDRHELLGRPVDRLVDREAAHRFRELAERRFSADEPPSPVHRSGLKAARKDGTVFPIDISLSPLDANGRRFIVAAVRDITERLRAEAKIRETLAALDATDEAVLIFSPRELRFTYVNQGAARLLGYPLDELHRLAPADLGEERLGQIFDAAGAGPLPVRQITTRLRKKDGREVPVEAGVQQLVLQNGDRRCIAIVRDIGARLAKEKEERRVQRLESIGTLAGGVAHDLNNALGPILMGMDLLRAQHPGNHELLDLLETCARRGANMVGQLLTFAKGIEGERRPIPPADLLGELRRLMQGTFPKNIGLVVRCDPAVPSVLGDSTQLHQVLLNLCVNARDAMPDGGTLRLEAFPLEVDADFARSVPRAKPGRHVVLQVSDTGTGIPQEMIERIFDPFFTTKGPDKGTGLGLSTVAGIVHSHEGFVHVSSRVGTGTTFSVYLPALDAKETGAAPDGSASPTSFRGSGERILVVDDEPAMRHMARAVLERLNFTPLVVADGAEALALAVENRETLRAIVTDLHMPRMDGLVLARALRRLTPEIPLVIASGRIDDATARQIETLQAARLEKPFTESRLAETLRAALSSRPSGA